MEKRKLSFREIWNMSFGFWNIFCPQEVSLCRIFQTLGANVDDISGLWIAAL
jgi:maltose/moltooligosaccharide transporter